MSDAPELHARRIARGVRRREEMRRIDALEPKMAPRCSCEHPAPHTDLEDHTTCLLCGRRP